MKAKVDKLANIRKKAKCRRERELLSFKHGVSSTKLEELHKILCEKHS